MSYQALTKGICKKLYHALINTDINTARDHLKMATMCTIIWTYHLLRSVYTTPADSIRISSAAMELSAPVEGLAAVFPAFEELLPDAVLD